MSLYFWLLSFIPLIFLDEGHDRLFANTIKLCPPGPQTLPQITTTNPLFYYTLQSVANRLQRGGTETQTKSFQADFTVAICINEENTFYLDQKSRLTSDTEQLSKIGS